MIKHELAPVPAGKAHHHRCEGREGEAVRQDRRRIDQTQAPVGTYDRNQRHRRYGVGPACFKQPNTAHFIALNALGETYAHLAAADGIDPALMHRVAAISCGALAMLPHNGAVVTLLAICGATQRGSYPEIMMVGLVGPLVALTVVIALGKLFGAF
jgi:hypothetical protein